MAPEVEKLQDLVDAAKAGEREAFDALVLAFQDHLLHTARYLLGHHTDAEDAVQETFLRAYRGVGQFKGEASFKSWLTRILINTVRSLHSRRSAKKRAANVVSLAEDGVSEKASGHSGSVGPSPTPSPEEALSRKELQAAIEQSIEALEPAQREVLVLRDVVGESYACISEALGVPLGSVKSRVHRARLEVQARLRTLKVI